MRPRSSSRGRNTSASVTVTDHGLAHQGQYADTVPEHNFFLFLVQEMQIALVDLLRRFLYISCVKTSNRMLKITQRRCRSCRKVPPRIQSKYGVAYILAIFPLTECLQLLECYFNSQICRTVISLKTVFKY